MIRLLSTPLLRQVSISRGSFLINKQSFAFTEKQPKKIPTEKQKVKRPIKITLNTLNRKTFFGTYYRVFRKKPSSYLMLLLNARTIYSKKLQKIKSQQQKNIYNYFLMILPLFIVFISVSFLLPSQKIKQKKIDSQNTIKQKKTVSQNEQIINSFENLFTEEQKNNSLKDVKSISFEINESFNSPIKFFTLQIEFEDGVKQMLVNYRTNPNIIKAYFEDMQKDLRSEERTKFILKDYPYSIWNAFSNTIKFFTPFIGVYITWYIFKRMSPNSIIQNLTSGKKKGFKIQALKNINIKFKDVAGMEQAKRQITQFVDFLKKSDKYIEMGARIPKGALLTGPPGTGKTMLAKACAGQAGVSFFYISGSEFVEMFVGLGASKVRDLFAKARQQAPSIIFIDQIDAIGRKRQSSRNQEKDSTLNQLLVQMDGFSSNETVIVLAASNRKDILDSALTRPGRFDRMVEIVLPDIKARQEIFLVHLKPLKIDPTRSLEAIAKRLSELSPGFSGADIANLCNEAAIIATRKKQQYITDKDFEDASERVTAGYQKKSLVNSKTKRRVALHEAGHAVAGWFLKGGDPLVKLTIIPRSKGALGYAQYLPKSSYIKTKNELIDKVAILLGGITSEQIFFGEFSTGGSDDLQKVYQITRKMVVDFGMGVSTYNITMDDESYVRKESDYLANKMDDEVKLLLEEAKTRCRNILMQKKQIVQSLANFLLEKQSINRNDIIKIMGERPSFI